MSELLLSSSSPATTTTTQPLLMGRKWKHLDDQQQIHDDDHSVCSDSSSFKLVSYNILAQLYAKHLQVSDPNICDWELRKQRLFKELMNYKADIICLQEMDLYEQYWKSTMMKGFAGGFDSSYAEKTGKRNGCGTFWRRDRFEMVQHLELHLEELNDYLEHSHHATNTSIAEEPFERRDVANLTLLRDLQSGGERGKLLLIVNNHLAWDPKYPEVKLCQMFYILKAVHQFLNKFAKQCDRDSEHTEVIVSVILCGDYNSLPDSEVYDLITKGRALVPGKEIKFNKHCELFRNGVEYVKSTSSSHHFHSSKQYLINPFPPAKSAYFEIYEKEPEFTNYTSTFHGTLDYVFTFDFDLKSDHDETNKTRPCHENINTDTKELNQKPPSQQLEIVDALEEISFEQAQEFSFLPSLIYPSDHIAHCVKFTWHAQQ
nr:unnamed protein product [Naegleria fowleri]